MQKVPLKSLVENGKIIYIFIIILMRQRDGMAILYTERSDTTQKGYLRWNKGSGRSLKIVTGKPFILVMLEKQHVKEDCDGIIPSASDWIRILISGERPTWATRTKKLEFED
jgi:hypothetical protein